MTNKLQESYNDSLEYVQNMVSLGGDGKMAEYSARYIQKSTSQVIDEAIAKLHLEQFATKADMQMMYISLLKWQIGIGVTTVSATVGIMITILKIMLH